MRLKMVFFSTRSLTISSRKTILLKRISWRS